jgi:tetratricopeptide (TPR) repeat protein
MYQGEFEKAHEDFREAIQQSPNDPSPRFFEALSDYKQQKFSVARDELNAAIDSGIVNSDLHYLLAECLVRIEPTKPANGIAELNSAIRIDPMSVSPRVLRGELLLDAGRPQKALEDLLVATRLQSGPQRDSRNAIYLLARTYRALGQEKQARALFARVGSQFSADTDTDLSDLSDLRIKDALHQ